MSSNATASALRALRRHSPVMRRLAMTPEARPFSTTAAPAIPVRFAATDKPELDESLEKLLNYYILPSYLPAKQQRLVYDPTKTATLKKNPVVIEIEGVEHKFDTIDRLKDRPNALSTAIAAIGTMQTKRDWQNLGPLLAGCRRAGIKLKSATLTRAVKEAGRTGNISTVLQCARNADKTGLYLDSAERVALSLVSISRDVEGSDPRLAAMSRADSLVDGILDILQREGHNATPSLHHHPMIRGMILNLKARLVQASLAAPEDEGRSRAIDMLKDEVALMQTLWNSRSKEMQEEITSYLHVEGKGSLSPLYAVEMVALNAQAIETCQKLQRDVPGLDLGSLPETAQALTKHVDSLMASRAPEKRSGAQRYAAILGREPAWAAAKTTSA